MDDGNPIHHLAIVADRVAGWGGDTAAELDASLDRAGILVEAALASLPGAAAVSFFSPDLRDRLLDAGAGASAAAACARRLAGISAAAARQGAGMRILGRRDRLPAPLAALPATAGPAGRCAVVFLDYGSRDEILRAAGALLRRRPAGPVGEEAFGALLDTAGLPDPDLVVSVGGIFEPHDFLLWQASYAELWHTPLPWRDFTPADLAAAVDDFRARQRRYGR